MGVLGAGPQPWVPIDSEVNRSTTNLLRHLVWNTAGSGSFLDIVGPPDRRLTPPVFRVYADRTSPTAPLLVREIRERGPPGIGECPAGELLRLLVGADRHDQNTTAAVGRLG